MVHRHHADVIVLGQRERPDPQRPLGCQIERTPHLRGQRLVQRAFVPARCVHCLEVDGRVGLDDDRRCTVLDADVAAQHGMPLGDPLPRAAHFVEMHGTVDSNRPCHVVRGAIGLDSLQEPEGALSGAQVVCDRSHRQPFMYSFADPGRSSDFSADEFGTSRFKGHAC